MKGLTSFKKRNTWDLIWVLFRTDFKLKYNDSLLGFLWVLVKPFSMFLIMYFVITKIFKSDAIKNFGLYLLLGNMFMTYWVEGTTQGMESLLSRANLILKVNFPRYIVLVSSTLLASVNFLINIGIFFVLASFADVFATPLQLAWFTFCILLLYSLITVVSMFISIMYVKFRDLKQIWELFNQILLWVTPVFYAVDTLAGKSKVFDVILRKINPVSVILTSARDGVLYNDITSQKMVFIWLVIVMFAGSLGYIYYKNSIKKIAEFF